MPVNISEVTASQKEEEARGLEKRIKATEAQIEQLNLRLLELSDEADSKSKQRRAAFQAKHKSKFETMDLRAALLGNPARWCVKLFDVNYYFEIPKGGLVNDVMRFINNPVVVEKEFTTDYAPIVPYEEILLRMLTGIQVPGAQEHSFKDKTVVYKLRVIRQTPEVLLNALANQAMIFENYLNIYLETELGN